MQTREFELSVGEAVRIGDRVFTLIDIESGEAAFRIDVIVSDSSEPETVEGYPLAD